MKFSFSLLAISVYGASVAPDVERLVERLRLATEEIRSGIRSDGNALLIFQMVQFYLGFAGEDTSLADPMLTSGCFCQLLVTSMEGKGHHPMDEFDE